MKKIFFFSLLGFILSAVMLAQDNSAAPIYPTNPHPAQVPANGQDAAPQQMNQNTGQNDQMPVFRVNVYARTASAVNYRHRGGSTTVDFRGTELMPAVSGHAKVDGKVGPAQHQRRTYALAARNLARRPISHLCIVGHYAGGPSRQSR